MPLIKGKSKKSFEKNVKTEMHEGKPQDQSLAIAYSMKRKAEQKKMAHGGHVEHEDARLENEEHQEDMLHQPENEAPPEGWAKPEMEHHAPDLTKRDRAMAAFWGHSPSGDHEIDEGHQSAQPHQGHQVHIHINPQMGVHGEAEEHKGSVKHNMPAAHEDSRMLNQHGEDETGSMGSYAEGGQIHDGHQGEEHEEDMVDRIMAKRQHCYSEGGKVANKDSGESTDDPHTFAKGDENEFDDLALRDDLESEYTGANSGDEDGSKLNQEDDHEDMISRIMRKRKK